MASPAQIAANQQNAQKSTGPKSEVGRAASSQNATVHGLTAKPGRTTDSFSLLDGEDRDKWQILVANLIHEHNPSTTTEHVLIRQLAEYAWMRSRAIYYQSGCLAEREHIHAQDQFALYLRYENQSQRGFVKTLHELQNMQDRRAKQEAETLKRERQKQLDEAAAKTAEAKEKRQVELQWMQKERHAMALADEVRRPSIYLDSPIALEVYEAHQKQLKR